jgi:hypothetical protein
VREWLRLLNAPCRDIAALISAAMDADLPRAQRWAVRIHLVYCRACRAYRRHLRLLREVLRLAADRAASGELEPSAQSPDRHAAVPVLSPEARERIRRMLQDR